MPINWWGKIFHSAESIIRLVLCSGDALCGYLQGWQGASFVLKFTGILFEIRKSLAIFVRRRSIWLLLLCDNRCDFSFHWKSGMSILQLFCPQLHSLVKDQRCVPAQSNCTTYFSETNYSFSKLLGNALVVSQNTVLYHSLRGILYLPKVWSTYNWAH